MVGIGKGSSSSICFQKHYVFLSTLFKSADTTPILVDVQPLENLSTLEKSGFSELFSIIFKKSAPEGLTNRGVCSTMLLSKDIINNLLDKSNINNL